MLKSLEPIMVLLEASGGLELPLAAVALPVVMVNQRQVSTTVALLIPIVIVTVCNDIAVQWPDVFVSTGTRTARNRQSSLAPIYGGWAAGADTPAHDGAAPAGDALMHPPDALGPPGHFRSLIHHNNHRIVSPPAECSCSTCPRSATAVLGYLTR